MAFFIYLHRENFQPEEPVIVDKNITRDVNFTFVDFIPSVIKRSGTAIPQCEVEYHSFKTMIEVANDWLKKNPEWEVVNCETVILLYKYNDVGSYYELRPNDCCFYIYGTEKNNVLKALSYIDLIPENKGDSDSGSKFEKLDDVINRFNSTIRSGGLLGRIITIESLQCNASIEWKIDTDTSLSTFSNKIIFILRIFFEVGSACQEEIGIADFAPQHISGGGFFKRPKFEPFDEVIAKASLWLADNPHLNFRNAQSIDIKMKSLSSVDTRCMSFTEHGDYIRIFRLTYTKPVSLSQVASLKGELPTTVSPTMKLQTKIFIPVKKSETILDIKQKLSDWVNQSLYCVCPNESGESQPRRYPQLLSAETVEVYAREFRDDNVMELEKAANDDTFQYNRFGNKNAYMFFALRIFYCAGDARTKTPPAASADNSSNDQVRSFYGPYLNFSVSKHACVIS